MPAQTSCTAGAWPASRRPGGVASRRARTTAALSRSQPGATGRSHHQAVDGEGCGAVSAGAACGTKGRSRTRRAGTDLSRTSLGLEHVGITGKSARDLGPARGHVTSQPQAGIRCDSRGVSAQNWDMSRGGRDAVTNQPPCATADNRDVLSPNSGMRCHGAVWTFEPHLLAWSP